MQSSKSHPENKAATEIVINNDLSKKEKLNMLRLFKHSNNIKDVRITSIHIGKKSVRRLCVGLMNNSIIHLQLNAVTLKDESLRGEIITALLSLTTLEYLDLQSTLSRNITALGTILMNNTKMRTVYASCQNVAKDQESDITIAKALIHCKYLTCANIDLNVSIIGLKAFELAFLHNPSLFTLDISLNRNLRFVSENFLYIKVHCENWVKLKTGEKIDFDITDMYRFIDNYYPKSKLYLEQKHSPLAPSLLADIAPSQHNMLCTRSLKSVCKAFLCHIEKKSLENADRQIQSTFFILAPDVVTHIFHLAQKGMKLFSNITDDEFVALCQ